MDDALALSLKAEIIERLHAERLRQGYYDADLAPLRARLQSIEAAHGLPPYEYWARGHGPPAWEAAMDEYEALRRRCLAQTWQEAGEPDIAVLLEDAPEEYQRRREVGHQSAHKEPPSLPKHNPTTLRGST